MADTHSSSYFQQRWEEAHRICETRLNKEDQRYISEIKDCDAFKASIEQMHITFQDLSKPSIVNQLDKSLVSLRSFVTLVLVAAGGSPFTAAILWGVLSLAVKVLRHPLILVCILIHVHDIACKRHGVCPDRHCPNARGTGP